MFKPHSKSDLLIFLHIPKTGGTTMGSIIRKNYKEKEIFFSHKKNLDKTWGQLTINDAEKVKIIRGHNSFGIHEFFPNKNFQYFTILRDPVERAISLYRMISRTPEHRFHADLKKYGRTLREFVESDKFQNTNNTMVRMISGNQHDQITDEDLQRALYNIDKHFVLIGLQHQFDEFLLELKDALKWRFIFYRSQLVAHVNKQEIRVEQDEETIAIIRKQNQMDQLLYEVISKRKNEQYKSFGEDFAKRVARFKRNNQRLTKLINKIPFFPPPVS
jgi:hypothetical protein